LTTSIYVLTCPGVNAMKTIKAVVRPHLYEEIAEALAAIGVVGITATDCMGHGRQKGHKEVYRGTEHDAKFVSKINLEVVVQDDRVNDVVEVLETRAKSGKVGDGKIFIKDMDDAIRIRDGQHGNQVL
jgi:nitrogen regulatory protein P-II 1